MYFCPGIALTEKRRLISPELEELFSFFIVKCRLESYVSTGICIMEVGRVQILKSEKTTVFYFKSWHYYHLMLKIKPRLRVNFLYLMT